MAGRGELSRYFIGAGAKVLRRTEVDPTVSKGHEFQGVDLFRSFVGTPPEREKIPVTWIWMDDSEEDPQRVDAPGTWYNSRARTPHRSPEYRLYYPAAAAPLVQRARAGDTLFLCMTSARRVLAILCPGGSTAERRLLWLFNLQLTDDFTLSQNDIGDSGGREIDAAARFILGELGIEAVEPDPPATEKLIKKFGLRFPTTLQLSAFARETLPGIDPLEDPDGALVAWAEHEEDLFRWLERQIVADRLAQGFMQGDVADVAGFLAFSLSVQNRRKSRAGYAFAHHTEALLKAWGIIHTREARTEKRSAADFLFPGEAEYADQDFPGEKLSMLAVKTSCKDRWRQVLSGAARIPEKHLLTLEPAISRAQIAEMQGQGLRLVVPKALHQTFHPEQRDWLIGVKEHLIWLKASGSAG